MVTFPHKLHRAPDLEESSRWPARLGPIPSLPPPALVGVGVARDLIVNRRVHAVYVYALPVMIAYQTAAMMLYKGALAWWLHVANRLIG